MRADGFVPFEFAPLPQAAGQPLSFWLEAPQAQPGNALTVMGATADLYPGGRAQFDHWTDTRGVQVLAFRLYYYPGPAQALGVLMQRLADGRPSVFGAPQLYAVLITAYFLGLAVLLVLILVQLRLRRRGGLPEVGDHPV